MSGRMDEYRFKLICAFEYTQTHKSIVSILLALPSYVTQKPATIVIINLLRDV